ncbi:hypothetical protein Ahy_A05g022899 [Arachis hypogaea]|uniref:Uncharacterized protein n=1 Tax=Arachis hypogaea TaxID=3818 RepID=A0A445D276_ARAHY|nr:hypothetical protein Ahy_A05g022899 [Arachis hypogaea]
MFDEVLKGPVETGSKFGLFHPNSNPKYQVPEPAGHVALSIILVVVGSGLPLGPPSLFLLTTPISSNNICDVLMKGRFTKKKAKLGLACQQSQKAPTPAPSQTSALHQDDSEISLKRCGSVHTIERPFCPPRSEPRPAPQTRTYSSQNSEPGHVHLDADAHDKLTTAWLLLELKVAKDGRPQSIGRVCVIYFSSCKRSTTETYIKVYNWLVDYDGTIKPAKLSVREAMERPNGRRIMLRFNNEKDEAGLLSGILSMLGSDYGKFPICEESWRHVTTKDKVYNECVKFDEDSEGIIRKNILKSMGKSWKDTRLRLYDDCYEPTLTVCRELIEITRDGTLTIAPNLRRRKNAINRSKQLYIHTGGSKSLARQREEESEQEGRIVGREELWIKIHKRRDGSYINDKAREIGERLLEIEQHDEFSRVLSQNDSIAQVFGREKLGRVRGVGFRPTPSKLFGTNLHQETQRKLNELQTELEAEKLKRKAMEDEAAADKKSIKVMESTLIYLFQRQGEELPPGITAGMCSME